MCLIVITTFDESAKYLYFIFLHYGNQNLKEKCAYNNNNNNAKKVYFLAKLNANTCIFCIIVIRIWRENVLIVIIIIM